MRLRAPFISLICSTLLFSACSVVGSGSDDEPAAPPAGPGDLGGEVVLVTHASFALPKKLISSFEADTGIDLTVRASGDAGTLVNKLVLTKNEPVGDVAYGIDNTFGSRAVDNGVLAPFPGGVPAEVADYALPGDDQGTLMPIDTGNVCVNIDTGWFADHDLKPPSTFEDLTDPAYNGLFVLPGAATSSTGMSFLLATIARFGDGWTDYWTDLLDNDARLVDGWEDAYYVDFTLGGGGDRPIVLSYDSSPAYTVTDGATSSAALLDTCFRQTEYAGVLEGATNPAGAQAVVNWLLSPRVQAALPTSMYVYPVRPGTALPEDWAKFAPQPTTTWQVDPADIDAYRETWLTTWSDLIAR